MCLSGGREHAIKDTEPESISDTPDLALPPEMPILIDFHALKDILGPPMYDTEVSVLFCRWPQRVAGWPGGRAQQLAWEFGAAELCLKIGDSPSLVWNAVLSVTTWLSQSQTQPVLS